ncbi:uncharacterized protein LOC132046404 [Lycium ferocissimum]|uniref:uncharacterized protein LOC132046404 n=1 Tax=Lycium ferocissimum TaxID=112874 RepID=UPI002815C1E3|nr:uncharacterized protein LOC132046404 [Lycium ferocissimum]
MNTRKWPMFEDWEEIFGKDRATGEFAEGPLDAAEDILRSQASGLSNDMSLGFPIDIDDEEEDDASHGPNIATEEAENAYARPSFTGASASEHEYAGAFENEHTGSQRNHKQGEHANRSSANVNEKEKSKKRKRVVEDATETFRKGMMEVMKNFTESQDKRRGALIDKIGDRDLSDLHGQIYSILESPAFELYSGEQRIKATMILCDDVRKMNLFFTYG